MKNTFVLAKGQILVQHRGNIGCRIDTGIVGAEQDPVTADGIDRFAQNAVKIGAVRGLVKIHIVMLLHQRKMVIILTVTAEMRIDQTQMRQCGGKCFHVVGR